MGAFLKKLGIIPTLHNKSEVLVAATSYESGTPSISIDRGFSSAGPMMWQDKVHFVDLTFELIRKMHPEREGEPRLNNPISMIILLSVSN